MQSDWLTDGKATDQASPIEPLAPDGTWSVPALFNEPRKANTMSKHTKTRHALGWIYRGWLLRKIKGHTGGTGWIVGGKIADDGQVDHSASRAAFGSSAEAETLAELIENVDAICNQQQAREAIAATEAKLGKGHELTCQRAIHSLGWDQDGEQAAELVRIYQGWA